MTTARQGRQRGWRFSLNSALVALTGICVFLAWIGAGLDARRRHDGLVRGLESRGFRVRQDAIPSSNGLSFTAWLALFDPSYSAQVTSVLYSGASPTLEDMLALTRFTHLCDIHLRRVDLAPGSIRAISKLPNLRALDLAGARIPKPEFLELRQLTSLWLLDLSATLIADDDIPAITACPALHTLSLSRCPITDRGAARLADFTQLKILDLAYTAVSDEGLVQLERLSGLAFLDVYGTRITDEGLADLRLRRPELSIVERSREAPLVGPDIAIYDERPDGRSSNPLELHQNGSSG